MAYNKKIKRTQGKNKYYSVSKKLQRESKSTDEFEVMLNNLSLEEVIALKLELAAKSVLERTSATSANSATEPGIRIASGWIPDSPNGCKRDHLFSLNNHLLFGNRARIRMGLLSATWSLLRSRSLCLDFAMQFADFLDDPFLDCRFEWSGICGVPHRTATFVSAFPKDS